MTGQVPFHEFHNDMAVMMRVARGYRPSRPVSCMGTTALDSLWELMQNCWQRRVEFRPTASQIVERLTGPPIGAKTTSSTTDWGDVSEFRRSLQVEPSPLPSVTQIERIIFGDG